MFALHHLKDPGQRLFRIIAGRRPNGLDAAVPAAVGQSRSFAELLSVWTS